jgi:hypothetical protein
VNPTGVIFDGMLKVGEFEDVGPPDEFGFRTITKVRLSSEYMDVGRGHSNRTLLYVRAFQGTDTYAIVDVVGLGLVFDPIAMWCEGSVSEFGSATFFNTTGEDGNYAN